MLPKNPSAELREGDIWTILGNAEGDDWVIGDIHGSSKVLETVLAQFIREKDRLFFVGDLTDKGPDSQGVIDIVGGHPKHKQILGVQGNHEVNFVNFAKARIAANTYLQPREKTIPSYIPYIKELYQDPDKAQQNLDEAQIEILAHFMSQFNPSLPDPIFLDLLHFAYVMVLNKGDWALNLNIETLKDDLKTISALPYILRVREEKSRNAQAFNLAHADLSLSDKELEQSFQTGKAAQLSPELIEHTTFAREGELAETRHPRSIRTFVGHSIGGRFREESNMVNLDIAMFNNNCVALFNATQNKLYLFKLVNDQLISIDTTLLNQLIADGSIHSSLVPLIANIDNQHEKENSQEPALPRTHSFTSTTNQDLNLAKRKLDDLRYQQTLLTDEKIERENYVEQYREKLRQKALINPKKPFDPFELTPSDPMELLDDHINEFEEKAVFFTSEAEKTKDLIKKQNLLKDAKLMTETATELKTANQNYKSNPNKPSAFLDLTENWEASLQKFENSGMADRHRSMATVVAKNVLVALTGIGTLAIIGKLIFTGELGFFRQRKTLENVDRMRNEVKEIKHRPS